METDPRQHRANDAARRNDQPAQPKKHHASDEELLASAMPIDASELEEVDEAEQANEQAGQGASAHRAGKRSSDPDAIEIDEDDDSQSSGSRIQLIGDRSGREEKPWKRQPTQTGQGASHVKTFIAKLRPEAIDHLDEQINDWLDEHPDYEVKFVTTAIGQLKGKIPEDAIFVNVWV